MNFSLKESFISEIFRILSINIDKINYLNFSLSKSTFNNTKINQFLSEFEYDLKLIYDILKQYQNESNFQNNYEHYNQEKGKNNYLNLTERIKNHYYLNNLEETNKNNNNNENKNKENKKYNLTINILTDKYLDSGKKLNKKFNKSSSCKLYKKKLSKNLIKNLKKMTLKGNFFSDRINEKILSDNKTMTYLTDYSSKNNSNETYKNKFRTNIDKNKASLKHLNNLYKFYDDFFLKNNAKIEYNKIPINNNKANLYNHINNYHSYNSHRSYEKNILEENKKQNDINYMNHYNYYIKDFEKNNNRMKEIITKKIIAQILQDNNKLKELKKNFGNDIGLKLLDGVLDNKQINNVYDFLEKHEYIEDKNLFRGSKYNYRNYKFENNNNSKNGILSFRDFIKDKKCHKYKKINFNDYSDIYNKIPLSN